MSALLTGCLAVFGGLVLIGIAVFVVWIGYFGRIAADHVLANAIKPGGREMPVIAGSLPYASADIQIIGGMGQGISCSLPWIMDQLAFPASADKSPVGLKMRQACAYHDYCYRHGAATYGYTQADCDFALQMQAFRICTFIDAVRVDESGREREGSCMRDARLVTLGVRVGGSDAFRPLSARDVPAVDDKDGAEATENRSTYFEFDPYPVKATEYTVYRIADAPPGAGNAAGGKAIYRFRIRPSGTRISYSTGFEKFTHYADIPGDPHYLTSPPLVVRTSTSGAAADWFVWWQRAGEDQTTGRLLALAPGLLHVDKWSNCFGLPAGCVSTAIIAIQIGKGLKEDPQLDQLLPADLGAVAGHGLSLVTLRHHSCRGEGKGNAPCYVHVLVDTNKASAPGTRGTIQWQAQEPLSIDDRLSPKPDSIDHDRYRNFAALPFVLDPKSEKAPVIVWTRRDANYQDDAILRRAKVGPGIKEDTRTDDIAVAQRSAVLQGFAEAREPAFILGRSWDDPILVSLTDDSAKTGTSSVALSVWPLPPPDKEEKLLSMPKVRIDTTRCYPGLEAEWLHRPPQILGQDDKHALAIFSLLRPHVSRDWTAATLQLAILRIDKDGSCPSVAWRGPVMPLETTKPSEKDETKDPVMRGRDAFARISRAPMLIADLDLNGSVDVTLADGPQENVPRFICSIAKDVCINPSPSQ